MTNFSIKKKYKLFWENHTFYMGNNFYNACNYYCMLNVRFIFYTCSIVVTILSIASTSILSIKVIRNTTLLSANTKLCDVESTIANHPEFLRFHINEDYNKWLAKYDLTPDEFSYLLKSFSLSSISYTTSPYGYRLIEKNSYRDMMFKTKSMQKAWPAIKMFLANKDFVNDMDLLYHNNLKKTFRYN